MAPGRRTPRVPGAVQPTNFVILFARDMQLGFNALPSPYLPATPMHVQRSAVTAS